MKAESAKTKRPSGFSLVEMLIVIAVIGVIAAIAVPSIGKINRSTRYTKDQRNAQQLAAVCAAASSAGHEFVTAMDDVNSAIGNVCTGHTVTVAESPQLFGTFFGIPGMGADDRTGAANFLKITNGRLDYDGDQVAVSAAFYD